MKSWSKGPDMEKGLMTARDLENEHDRNLRDKSG